LRFLRLRALGLVVAAAGSAAVVGAGVARADGDPASDVLYFQDVYLPYTKPAADVAARLQSTVTNAIDAGFRIKVAVIASPQDLGAVPSLFNKAPLYARFLGAELVQFYRERLLIVMPVGFGFYDNGAPTTREESILKDVSIGEGPDGLTESATTAVEKLRAAQVVKKGADSVPPKVTALPASGVRGKPVTLAYRVSDNSGKSSETVRVYGENLALFGTIKSPLEPAKPGTRRSVVWKVRKSVPKGQLRWCVLASDASGNQSRTSCAPLRIS
jgi:hypothetical protein